MSFYTNEIDMMSLLRVISPIARTIGNSETDKALKILSNLRWVFGGGLSDW